MVAMWVMAFFVMVSLMLLFSSIFWMFFIWSSTMFWTWSWVRGWNIIISSMRFRNSGLMLFLSRSKTWVLV